MEIVEVCTVAPPQASTPPNSELPLTFFDLFWLRLPQYERLFFYELPDLNKSVFHTKILPRLKQSLSLTLQHFLLLTGSVTWPPTSTKPAVEYSKGDAVHLTVAKSEASFHHLSGNDLYEATACHPLIPKLSVSRDRAEILAIQVTVFPGQGFTIGLSFHHAILDGKSLSLFVKSWSHTCRSLGNDHCDHHQDHQSSSCSLPPDLEPCLDRTLIKDTAGIGEICVNQWLNVDGPNNRSLLPLERELLPDLIRGTFQCSRQKIENIRQFVMNKIKNTEQRRDNDDVHVSAFSLICAYTWACLVKAEGESENKTNMSLAFFADCRSRLEPPLPATYFGNCLVGKLAVANSEDLSGEEGLVVAVQAISNAIKSLDKGLLDGAKKAVSSLASNKPRVPGRRLYYTIAGSPRFEVYNTDFGWGKPRKVDVVSIDRTGSICLSDNRDGDGVEIGLVLMKHQMQAFASLFAEGLE